MADAIHHVYRGKKPKKVLQQRAARHLGHPHTLPSGNDIHRHPMPDKGATRAPKASKITRNHEKMVARNLETLAEENPDVLRTEVEVYRDKMNEVQVLEQSGALAPMTPAKREQYVALETHREMASVILGAGGTFEEAADHAGVAVGTVRKWYEDLQFRSRVDEQKAIVGSRLGGRILSSLDRLTGDEDKLDAMPVKDRLAIYDRFDSTDRGRSGPGHQTNILVTPYQGVMDRLKDAARGSAPTGSVDDASHESGGFPVVGADSPPVAGGST